MVSVYKQAVGSRNYHTGYNDASLKSALNQIQCGKISFQKAGKHYSIPAGTLHNKLKKNFTGEVGGQYKLTPKCKRELFMIINALCEWKTPLNEYDLCLLVKNYLNCNGITDASFKSSLPSVDWLNSFMKRHNLSKQIADDITSARAEITLDVSNEYFDHLTYSIEEISPENCFNYNKISVMDNPGIKNLCMLWIKTSRAQS